MCSAYILFFLLDFISDICSVLQSHADFQRKVVDIAKRAIMPYFKRRELSKEQYKGIMKKAVNKVG